MNRPGIYVLYGDSNECLSAMRLLDRKGQPFRVICRGTMNSALVEFEDGFKVVTSRNALRRRKP
jgi:hypothetical protein